MLWSETVCLEPDEGVSKAAIGGLVLNDTEAERGAWTGIQLRGTIILGGWRKGAGDYSRACRLSVARDGGDLSVWTLPGQAVVTGAFGYPGGYVVRGFVQKRGSLQFMLSHKTPQANGITGTGPRGP